MLQKLIFIPLFLILSHAFGQKGIIKGIIKDAANGEGIIGANVYIHGTTTGAATDINGNFTIGDVEAGNYALIVSSISYRTDTLNNIQLQSGETIIINHEIREEAIQLTDIIVTGNRMNNTEISVLSGIRKKNMVVSGISAQQISLSQDRDAAQVVKRIPGVTILNNRFVNVRGLNERYNTVLLNGIIAPSSEVDSRAFSFDLIPSAMIDRMMVYKSGSPELPGEFSGAVIDIETKNTVEDHAMSFSVSSGLRLGTTFSDFNSYRGSNTDWLGFDNGIRQLPGIFPSQNLRGLPATEDLSTISRSLPNVWGVSSQTAAPDFRMTFNMNNTYRIGSKKLSNITSIGYSTTCQRLSIDNNYYDVYLPETSYRRYNYEDVRDANSVRLSVISNFILELNPGNKIEFRNFFSQQGVAAVTLRRGIEDAQGVDVNNRAFNYTSRSIYSGQVSGNHEISKRINLDWGTAYSMSYADQPDYRRIRSQRPTGSEDPFAIQIPPNASTLDAGRYYSKLVESTFTNTLNTTYIFNPDAKDDAQARLQTGYYVTYTDRMFNARWFSYKWNNIGNRPQQILYSDFTELFAAQNVGIYDGDGRPPYFVLEEGTNFSDKYTGKNLLTAGYFNYTLPISRFKISVGLRLEYNRQQLGSFETDGSDIQVDNPVTSALPFVNTSFNISSSTQLRLSYGKTINRPVLRELAPFNFYDFDRNANTYGNPNLVTAQIHNVDLRWENYPSPNESIMIGAFYKYFQNPIEVILAGGSNLLYTYKNAEDAHALGAEAEVRKSLRRLSGNTFVDRISVLLNATWINSQINLGNVENQAQKRSMQGQSPFIFNSGIYYTDFDKGWQINISHNIFGPRIFAVGDDLNSTQFELSRHQLDVTISKTFGSRWEAKVGFQDLLNQATRVVQDTDGDLSLHGLTDPIQTFKPGQYISAGLTIKL